MSEFCIRMCLAETTRLVAPPLLELGDLDSGIYRSSGFLPDFANSEIVPLLNSLTYKSRVMNGRGELFGFSIE
jgi:hypothetical protein